MFREIERAVCAYRDKKHTEARISGEGHNILRRSLARVNGCCYYNHRDKIG